MSLCDVSYFRVIANLSTYQEGKNLCVRLDGGILVKTNSPFTGRDAVIFYDTRVRKEDGTFLMAFVTYMEDQGFPKFLDKEKTDYESLRKIYLSNMPSYKDVNNVLILNEDYFLSNPPVPLSTIKMEWIVRIFSLVMDKKKTSIEIGIILSKLSAAVAKSKTSRIRKYCVQLIKKSKLSEPILKSVIRSLLLLGVLLSGNIPYEEGFLIPGDEDPNEYMLEVALSNLFGIGINVPAVENE